MPKTHSTGELTPARRAAQDARYAEGREYDYVFIGSGNSALAAAALLAQAGHRVCLIEAHDLPGGYAQTFKYGDYAFCAQVHYIWGCGPGGAIRQLVDRLGLDAELTYELYDPDGYDHMVTPDGKVTKIPFGLGEAAESVARSYPEQRPQVVRFFELVAKLYDEIGELPKDRTWRDYLSAPFKFPGLLRYQNKTLQQVFDELRLGKETQAVLSANAGDFLAPPEKLSMLLYAAMMGGYGTGAYYPTRHYEHHVASLARFVKDQPGCDIYYETEVTGFEVTRGRLERVTCADGKVFAARRGFVCNMDPQRAARLIGLQHFPRAYQESLEYEYSDSALIVYLGLSGVDLRAHGFGRHNTWHLSQWDMNQAWREQNDHDDHSRPWMFISTPTLLTDDPSHAPPGHHIMELGTSLSYRIYKDLKERDPGAYKKRKRAVADRLLDLVEKHYAPGLRKHIKLHLIGTPTTNEDYCLAPQGNAYGASLTPFNVKQRLGFATPIDNLHFCNATAGYPSFCGSTTTGLELYMELTGDRFIDKNGTPSRRERELWARREGAKSRPLAAPPQAQVSSR